MEFVESDKIADGIKVSKKVVRTDLEGHEQDVEDDRVRVSKWVDVEPLKKKQKPNNNDEKRTITIPSLKGVITVNPGDSKDEKLAAAFSINTKKKKFELPDFDEFSKGLLGGSSKGGGAGVGGAEGAASSSGHVGVGGGSAAKASGVGGFKGGTEVALDEDSYSAGAEESSNRNFSGERKKNRFLAGFDEDDVARYDELATAAGGNVGSFRFEFMAKRCDYDGEDGKKRVKWIEKRKKIAINSAGLLQKYKTHWQGLVDRRLRPAGPTFSSIFTKNGSKDFAIGDNYEVGATEAKAVLRTWARVVACIVNSSKRFSVNPKRAMLLSDEDAKNAATTAMDHFLSQEAGNVVATPRLSELTQFLREPKFWCTIDGSDALDLTETDFLDAR